MYDFFRLKGGLSVVQSGDILIVGMDQNFPLTFGAILIPILE